MPLPPRLAKLLQPRRRPFIYVPAATALSFLALVALPILSIPIAMFFMFAIPYWMGERRPRRLFIAALVMLLTTAMAMTSFITWNLSRPLVPEQRSEDGILSAGTVGPLTGDADTTFTFTVRYTHVEPPKEPPRVNLTSTFSAGQILNETMMPDPDDLNYEDGVVYEYSTRLLPDAYLFHFAVLMANDSWVVTSDAFSSLRDSRGPVNLSPYALFGNIAISVVSFIYLVVGIPLLLVLAIYSWMARRRARRERGVQGEDSP